MISPKKAKYFLLVISLLSTSYSLIAKKLDDKTYQHKMELMEGLSIYKMTDYDTLFHILTLDTAHGNEYKSDYYGWIDKRNNETIKFVNTNGKEFKIDLKSVNVIEALPVNDATIQIFINNSKQDRGFEGLFGRDYLLNLWLHKKGKTNYAKQLLPKNDTFFSDGYIIDGFGIIYYDDMLNAYSHARNYSEAVVFGKHLSKDIFRSYEYQKEAIALTAQLQKDTDDFKAFHLPDSLEWNGIKKNLSRKDQINYLAERLRLLNCIQPGQPADISYQTYQYSVSYTESHKLGFFYWDYSAKYNVVNPYTELIHMKLNPQETELLLPYLLDESYIPSFYYFRDFFSSRTLHKVNRVTHDLIFETTNKRFFTQQAFDSLSFDQKKLEVEKIRQWCNENAGLSDEALVVKTLKTANKWVDFNKALETAHQQKYGALLPIVVARFNDFKNDSAWAWPSHKGIMAEMVYNLGDATYIDDVKKWSKDTTDDWVNLWTSLFLLKNDKADYDSAMTSLEAVLKKCDGATYYPHAMDLLFAIHDKRTMKLAEGIIDKPQFQFFIAWDSYLNFVKKLLLLKSDYTFKSISDKLDHFSPEEMQQLKQTNGQRMMLQSDFYVLAVDQLKNDAHDYLKLTDTDKKLIYKKALKQWFDNQYGLLKEGKPNELHLIEVKTELPVETIDSQHY